MDDGTMCPKCGFGVAVDAEGLCLACGATAMGRGVDEALRLRRKQEAMTAERDEARRGVQEAMTAERDEARRGVQDVEVRERVWYAYDPEDGITVYDTAAEAQREAGNSLDRFAPRRGSGDVWPEDITHLAWGEMVPHARAQCVDHGVGHVAYELWALVPTDAGADVLDRLLNRLLASERERVAQEDTTIALLGEVDQLRRELEAMTVDRDHQQLALARLSRAHRDTAWALSMARDARDAKEAEMQRAVEAALVDERAAIAAYLSRWHNAPTVRAALAAGEHRRGET